MISAEQLYTDSYPKVSAYVRGKVSNHHDAEELVSAVFLKAVQKADSYDPAKASLSTWVYTITRNTVTDYFRTHRTMVLFAVWNTIVSHISGIPLRSTILLFYPVVCKILIILRLCDML